MVAASAAGIGGLTESGVPENDAHVYAEGVRRGGTLVTARVDDDASDAAGLGGSGGRSHHDDGEGPDRGLSAQPEWRYTQQRRSSNPTARGPR